jgi:phytoene dehydrogenase-like protein
LIDRLENTHVTHVTQTDIDILSFCFCIQYIVDFYIGVVKTTAFPHLISSSTYYICCIMWATRRSVCQLISSTRRLPNALVSVSTRRLTKSSAFSTHTHTSVRTHTRSSSTFLAKTIHPHTHTKITHSLAPTSGYTHARLQHTGSSASASASANARVVSASSLTGKCSCGTVGWSATGSSSINFVCHCSICRTASGLDALPAAGFKSDQIMFENEAGIEARVPSNSKNPRLYCKKCNDYVAEDARRVLGVYALPLHRVDADKIDDCYKPNAHIFYTDRVKDVDDALPKWSTVLQGELAVPPTEPKSVPASTPAGEHGSWNASVGSLRKDVQPLSANRVPYPDVYHFTESDPVPNHTTLVTPAKVQERVARKYNLSAQEFVAPANRKRDAIVIGGGHNGLVSAAYLAKHGIDTLVLERRHCVGGAAVTEEMVPGFKFSRASYLAGLLRPAVIEELNLHKYGFKYLPRDPSSFTPTRMDSPNGGNYLILGSDEQANYNSIAQFSKHDAEAFPLYEEFLGEVREVIQPLLDGPPPNPLEGNWRHKLDSLKQINSLIRVGYKNKSCLVPFYELFTGPASHILDRWFESEILKTTLATDAVIGALVSPTQAGSAYVLLHHVMGEAAGKKGVWAYVEGGMGSVSEAIAASARESGAEIVCNAAVSEIMYEGNGANARATGVRMSDGTVLEADTILSGTTPYHTFLELMPGMARDSGYQGETSPVSADFQHHIRFQDQNCGAFKINCAVDSLPNFECYPSPADGSPGPMHFGTIHFESRMEEVENAYREASMGVPASRPVIEMTIPSSLDNTISPPGKHVVQLFVQFAPYDIDPKIGNWADQAFKTAFVNRVFSIVDEFAPGFSNSVIGYDALSPLDLERVFGLHKGNIFHGSLSLHQLGYARPMSGYSSYRSPLKSLYMCASGTHPGGGVMGAPGRNCAKVVLADKNISFSP